MFQSIADKLTAANVPAEVINQLNELGYDTEAVLCAATVDDLEQDGIKSRPVRLKIKTAFPHPQADLADSVQVDVTAASVTTAAAPVATGEFDYLLSSATGVLGLSSAALGAKINPQFIERAATAAVAAVIRGTGALDVFGPSFWSSMSIEDLVLREKIDTWLQSYQQPGTERDFQYLLEGVGKLFDNRFESLLSTAQQLSAYQSAADLVGSQARVDVGGNATNFASLGQLLPLTAEEISDNAIRSQLPEAANRAARLVSSLLIILKDPTLQAYGGVVAPASADAGAIAFLENRLGRGVANQVRLALAYEALIKAIAVCPAEGNIKPGYLKVIGTLAQSVANLHTMVAAQDLRATSPAAAVSGSSAGSAPGPVQTFKFSLSLKFEISRKG